MPYSKLDGWTVPEQRADLPIDFIQRAPKLSDLVAQQLKQLLLARRFKPGDRLPSERELAEHFGVSRTVVREAIRSLAAAGLLKVQSGSGTRVRVPSSEAVAESMTLLLRLRSGQFDYHKVIEVRRMLEVEIAGLAALRRTEEDLERLEAILERARSRLDDPDTFVETDLKFHAALAQATQNELFSVLLASVADILAEGRRLALRVPGTPMRALVYHTHILDAVRAGDVARAREAMDRHMDEARDTMARALELYGGEHT
jgi:GntR family transcriptional repressor for pyruvate dehydrogenase complex